MLSAEQLKVGVPEGTCGPWRVEHFSVSHSDSETDCLRSLFGGFGRFVPPGDYTRLMRGFTLVMSDTPDEIRDHRAAIRRAAGRCLVHGLGLGVVANAILMKPEVEEVTVVEQSTDVCALVLPWLRDQLSTRGQEQARLVVRVDNALTWKPPRGSRWDVVWHDIWDGIYSDNLDDMRKLHRRFGRCAGWQGSWARGLCERGR